MVRWTVMGAGLGVVVGVLGALDTRDWSLLLAPLVIAPSVGLLLGTFHSMTWLIWPCRVRYLLANGEFVASRGSRQIKRIEIGDLESIAVGDQGQGLGWFTVIFTGWFGYLGILPTSGVVVRSNGRWDMEAGDHDLPTILLWGDENWRDANRALAAALTGPMKSQE